MKIKSGIDYRTLLKEEFQARFQKNPRYSLRTFAKQLSVSSGRLSEILNGNDGMSVATARKLAGRLGYSQLETEYFCTLVESENSRSPKKRHMAKMKLQAFVASPESRMQLDVFAMIAEWYHMAILELASLPYFKSDTAWIAKKLGISQTQADLAVTRLLRLKLLARVGGKLVSVEEHTISQSGIPSHAIKTFHSQILQLANSALHAQSVEEREFVSTVLTIDRTKIEDAKVALHEFRKQFCLQNSGAHKDRNEVYCLSFQFFRLGEKGHV